MELPINLTGGSYKEKSKPVSNQVTRNFWPKAIQGGKTSSPYILQSFYGIKDFSVQPGTQCRGMIRNQGRLYKVTDTTLFEVASDGTHTALGFIAGSNRCIMSAMGAQIIIANGSGAVYTWDGTSLTQNSNENLGTPNGVTVINNQAIYDQGADGQGFDVSDVGKPDDIDGLNNASAEVYSDNLIIPYGYRETLYLMGERTIELWWNSGQGNPPFDKIQGAVIQRGLGAKHSVAENPDFVFFLGDDRQFHTLTGGSSAVETVISTPAMAKQLQDYAVVDDCIGWTMELEGQWFYCATFPNEDITWVYPIGGEWFEWGSGDGRIRANSYVNLFGKHLVGDFASGNIYELDAETYTDAGETIMRVRDSAPIHGGLFRNPGKEFILEELELIMETGVGLTSGQGVNPKIMISFSGDGGKTFGTERIIPVGRLGETDHVVRVKNCGRFKTCVIRLRVSDPIFWTVHNAKGQIEVCI
jgi:hypothetical protein